MLRKTIFRLCGAGLLALGLPSLYVAHYGALWQPGIVEYLGWLQLYLLRPGLYIVGAMGTVMGLWQLWLRWTLPGMVLSCWWDDVNHDWQLDEQLAEDSYYTPGTWRSAFSNLWYRRGCMIGRHPPAALYYEDPIGTCCEDCGLRVSRDNVVPDRDRSYRDGGFVGFTAEHDADSVRDIDLPPDQQLPTTLRSICCDKEG